MTAPLDPDDRSAGPRSALRSARSPSFGPDSPSPPEWGDVLEVGDLVGHRHATTTDRYARVRHAERALATVTPPGPIGGDTGGADKPPVGGGPKNRSAKGGT